jgi:hypothetical protein
MVSIAKELEAPFTPGEVDKGFRWAKGADLEEMAKGWLVSLTRNVKPMKAIKARAPKKGKAVRKKKSAFKKTTAKPKKKKR